MRDITFTYITFMVLIMRKLYLFALFLVTYEFTTYSANDMIMPGMLQVVSEFKSPLSYVALSLSLYMLGECCLQLWLGPLAERFGKRQIILWGNLSFLVFTCIIASAENMDQFMLGRFLQGSGMAFIAMGYALIHEKFNDKDAVKIIAIMGNVSILAPLLGPLIGGIIVSYASWHYIFILTLILGLTSLIGLYRYTPTSASKVTKLNFKQIFKHYITIAKSKNFALGVTCTILGAMPLLIWIGLAPNLILHNLHLSYKSYIIYQIITIGGLSVSSLVIQFLAGRWQFHQLILRGTIMAFGGVFLSFIGSSNINLIAAGLFIYSLGLGLANGSIMRIIMSNKNVSQSMAASLMTFSQTLSFAIGIEISDFFCDKFNYSGLSFTFACLVFALASLVLTIKFAKLNQTRSWE